MRDAKFESRVADILRDVTTNPGLSIEPSMALRSIPGWDSVSLVNAMLSIEDEFEIEFQANEFATLNTVEDIARLIETMHG
jgi:acyl carrier protein